MQTQEKPLPKIPLNDIEMLTDPPTPRSTTRKRAEKVVQASMAPESSSPDPFSTNDSYYSPHDWPLQVKARPWSPIFSQDQHRRLTVQHKLSSDTLGAQSLRGLRELYDPFQPEKARLETESLFEDEVCMSGKQEKSSSLWLVLKMFGFGRVSDRRKDGRNFERVRLLGDDV